MPTATTATTATTPSAITTTTNIHTPTFSFPPRTPPIIHCPPIRNPPQSPSLQVKLWTSLCSVVATLRSRRSIFQNPRPRPGTNSSTSINIPRPPNLFDQMDHVWTRMALCDCDWSALCRWQVICRVQSHLRDCTRPQSHRTEYSGSNPPVDDHLGMPLQSSLFAHSRARAHSFFHPFPALPRTPSTRTKCHNPRIGRESAWHGSFETTSCNKKLSRHCPRAESASCVCSHRFLRRAPPICGFPNKFAPPMHSITICFPADPEAATALTPKGGRIKQKKKDVMHDMSILFEMSIHWQPIKASNPRGVSMR